VLPDEPDFEEPSARSEAGAEVSSAETLDAFQQRTRLAEDRLAEVLGAYRKLKGDNEGYRDRITRNIERRYDQRRERLLLRFIEILDNLDRALEAAERTYAGNPLIEGLILVRTQLLHILKEEGLERVPVVGLPYDPAHSEAVETQAVDDPEQHHVVLRDLQRGYRLSGRMVRACKVLVGEYQASESDAVPVAQESPVVQAVGGAAAVAEAPREPAKDEEITLSGLKEDSGAHTAVDDGSSIEDIVAKAEAQEALFPTIFDPDAKKPDGEPE
jgi:molecular chaperone GrpE